MARKIIDCHQVGSLQSELRKKYANAVLQQVVQKCLYDKIMDF